MMKSLKSTIAENANFTRRNFIKTSSIGLAAFSLGLPGSLAFAKEDKYPKGPIDVIVPFGVGGGTDIWMRTFAVALAHKKNLKVPINIRNVPGAASLRGAGVAFKAKPDGYSTFAMNPPSTPWSWYTHQPAFDITKFVGISVYVREPGMIVVRKGLKYKDFESVFKAYENNELKFFASLGTGTVWHVASLLLQRRVGLKWQKYVSYKGAGDVIAALYRKEVDVGIITAASAIDPVSEGRLVPIAMLGLEKRLKSFPNTPTLNEFGKPILKEAILQRAIYAPPGLPADKQAALEKAFIKAQKFKLRQAYYKALDLEPALGTGKEAEQIVLDAIKVAEEIKLRDIIKKSKKK
jgi:tripartite-type tricarboxylate transporter receptor subunit TctC